MEAICCGERDVIAPACERISPLSLAQRLVNPRIIILGEVGTKEMRGVLASVCDVFRGSALSCYPVPAEKELVSNSGIEPNLVVVCQSYPDQFNRQDVQSLLRRFPLSRFVCCFGLWCESDGRSRDIWPRGTRVPVRLARQRLLQERAVLAGRREGLPLTAGRDEAFAFDYGEKGGYGEKGQERTAGIFVGEKFTPRRKAVVISPDRALRSYWEEALRQSGYDVGSEKDGSTTDLMLFDADPWSPERAARLRTWRERSPRSFIVALMNFARPEDEAAVRTHGANTVCAKLTSPEQLLRMIRRAAFVSNGGVQALEY